ncbi:sugar phosphate isomerase/epimerase family protein [Maribacter algicola]|uniref:Sugar phosphate isomerase/epimerase family protein n=1 Tax=Meishania litoralis TaxID=3434685 RepID=A0ACC7LM77_9FLAO
MNNRRTFVKNATLGTITMVAAPQIIHASKSLNQRPDMSIPKISLAQWSLHRALEKGEIKAVDFAAIAKNTYDIDAIEYVNQFYVDRANDEKFWSQLRQKAENEGVKSLLIMVDNEGELGNLKADERKKAVENHFKWINAAKILGCHSIRVNAFGKGSMKALEASLMDGLGQLAEYGAKEEINVLVENHGLHTSNASFITGIIKQIGNPFLGTLPDFGNWCLTAEWGSTANGKNCAEIYPQAKAIEEFLPFAKGVSAKTYDFDSNGNQSLIDYPKLLQLVKDSNFDGYIGIEYEGENLSEHEGIKATKALLEKIWATLK